MILERLGTLLGLVSAGRRRARPFDPEGPLREGVVIDVPYRPAWFPDLSGPALVRLSVAPSRRPGRPDALGCALRIGREGPLPGPAPARGDQDLLFATAPRATRADDYLKNRYQAPGAFEAGGVRVELRLSPRGNAREGHDDRDARLARAVEAGRALFAIEARRVRGRGWLVVAHVLVGARLDAPRGGAWFDPSPAAPCTSCDGARP